MTARISWPLVFAAAIVVCVIAAAATFALSGSDNPAAAAPAPTGTAAPSGVSGTGTAVNSAAATPAKPTRTPVPHAISVPAGAIQSEAAGSPPNASGPGYGGPAPSETIAEVLPNTTEFQRRLLQDGDLTREEYEDAVFATVQCIADHGFVVAGPTYDNVGHLVYQFGTKDTALGGQYSVVSDSCASQYSRDVSVVWSTVLRFNNPPPTNEQMAQAQSDLVACLVSNHVEVADAKAPILDIYKAAVAAGKRDQYNHCQNDVLAQYGYVPGR